MDPQTPRDDEHSPQEKLVCPIREISLAGHIMKPVIAAWCGVSAAQKAIGEEFPRKEFHKVVLLTGNASPAAPEPVIAELDHPPRADWPIGPHCFRPVERRFLTSIRAAARLRL